MNSPRTLVLSIAATGCGFLLALVGVIGQASHAATSPGEVAMAPSTVAVVAQDVRHVDSRPYVVALELAASRPQAR
jgi:hypothetical protein